MFGDEVAAGRRRIASFCRCQAQGGTWRYEVCLYVSVSVLPCERMPALQLDPFCTVVFTNWREEEVEEVLLQSTVD
jgi:hypothetical protein